MAGRKGHSVRNVFKSSVRPQVTCAVPYRAVRGVEDNVNRGKGIPDLIDSDSEKGSVGVGGHLFPQICPQQWPVAITNDPYSHGLYRFYGFHDENHLSSPNILLLIMCHVSIAPPFRMHLSSFGKQF